MARSTFLPRGVLLLMLFSASIGPAGSDPAEEQSKDIALTELRFYQDKEGLIVANAWGDPADGPHSNFIKIPGDTTSPRHTHTASYYGVVIAGVVVNQPTTVGPDKPLMPGSYWYQKGGEPHVTKCISPTECLIFVTSKGSFDFLVVQ
jgi:hypothetical protein